MIFSDLAHVAEQTALTPALEAGFNYLKNLDLSRLEEGRYPVDGERVFAIVAFYEAKAVGEIVELEGHCKYIDLQFLAAGQESIAWAPEAEAQPRLPYDADSDAWVCNLPAERLTWVKMTAGQVAVLYPSDAHAPQYAAGQPSAVKKVVVKVAIP
jgi:biofilm protein TabA